MGEPTESRGHLGVGEDGVVVFPEGILTSEHQFQRHEGNWSPYPGSSKQPEKWVTPKYYLSSGVRWWLREGGGRISEWVDRGRVVIVLIVV